MTQAVNTPRYGNAFQARIFWTYAAKLLSSTTAVRRVGLRVWALAASMTSGWSTTRVGGRWISLVRRLQVERFQCKWHVGNGTFTHVDLTDPKYSGATTTSLLQRARDAHLSDQVRRLCFAHPPHDQPPLSSRRCPVQAG
jgi:hypothetical protein